MRAVGLAGPLTRAGMLSLADLRADQRERVVVAARGLLAEGGYPAMTWEAVARAARVSRSDLPFVTSSREQLAADVYADAAAVVIDAVCDSRAGRGGDRVAAAVRAVVDALHADRERAAIVLRGDLAPGAATARVRVALLDTLVALLRASSPQPITELHARVVVGGLRTVLTDLPYGEDPARVASDLTRLCVVLRDGA